MEQHQRAYNFNAGPAALPLEVLERAQSEFIDFRGHGMSIMEMSHRGAVYEQVHNEAKQLLKELFHIPDGYDVLFLQGGASTQFAMVPMNLLAAGKVGAYVHTGSWASKAIKEAELIGETRVIASTEADRFMRMPAPEEIVVPANAAYVHLTSNETIEGTQFAAYPDTGAVPLIADMSSDILCRPVDVSKFGMIYAGAQKNLGPSGVTVVIAKEELLANSPATIPTMLRYSTHYKNNSLYNTPSSFSIYMVNLVLQWLKDRGGLAQVERDNQAKAELLYGVIDSSGDFYRGCAARDSRSMMNVTFRLTDEELEKTFIKEAGEAGFVGLKGHRSVGGLRASIYNAVPYASCEALVQFMKQFQQKNG
ncbi:3-phosphoserine/phosphohydroxythreonine transaminase [Paenibacillus dendritiformis]|uniref:Phosphoserine aminotransferase n=1 Tax=Paenibacillus dendritiformis C454 TaxID=1131935 RepID=H3SEE4_9BACL|nr:3-phosphoserine/phosphohydroxythreonine transaminase [Paenibacillus dendritiformis]EHQ62525.1 3-phosphoserine/phosphohydroxythreonine aminotransferase [Paenibacillus dendritiformis C454]CAH8772353.1 3-phosphoserine/phosphohydroxythreonine transaminase [Paenibacillus dendritiformis]